MPVYVMVVRKAVCLICNGSWLLEGEEKAPERCQICASADWELGRESRATTIIRQGLLRQQKALNPGATSLKRREHGRRQFRQFKPKAVENQPSEGEN